MRLFVALNLPPDERLRMYTAATPLREAELPVRWTVPESLHVTLQFLGDVAQDRLPELEDALGRAAQFGAPFTMRLRALGAFPNLRRPSVVWVGVEPEPPLLALQEQVEAAFGPLGFAPEARAFHPHVTLGRARDPRAAGLAALARIADRFDYRADVDVTTIDLMRSRLGGGPARYETLLAVPLGAPQRN